MALLISLHGLPAHSQTECNLPPEKSPRLRGVRLGMRAETISKVLRTALIPKAKDTEYYNRNLPTSQYLSKRVQLSDPVLQELIQEKTKVGIIQSSNYSYIPINLGETRAGLQFDSKASRQPESLNGVTAAFFSFYNKELYSIFFMYDSVAFDEFTLNQFAEFMAGALGVPAEAWAKSEGKAYLSLYMRCENFDVWVHRGSDKKVHISIQNIQIYNAIMKRAEEAIMKMYEDRKKKILLNSAKGFKP